MDNDIIFEQLKNDFEDFMHWIHGGAASIDPTTQNQTIDLAKKFLKAREDGTWLKHIILQSAKEAIESDNPSERSKDSMSRNAKKFAVCVEQIISSCDGKCGKSAALGAIENAFLIAAYSPVSDRILNLIHRNQAAIAREGKKVEGSPKKDQQLAILREEMARTSRMKILLPAVNARLRASGFDVVTEKTLSRWKKKL